MINNKHEYIEIKNSGSLLTAKRIVSVFNINDSKHTLLGMHLRYRKVEIYRSRYSKQQTGTYYRSVVKS